MDAYFATTAQVIPTLLLALVLEDRVFRAMTTKPTVDVPPLFPFTEGFMLFRSPTRLVQGSLVAEGLALGGIVLSGDDLTAANGVAAAVIAFFVFRLILTIARFVR